MTEEEAAQWITEDRDRNQLRRYVRALRLLYNNGNSRHCSLPYLRWMLYFVLDCDEWSPEDTDAGLKVIRDELTHLGLIGWSHPPRESCVLFLTKQGLDFMEAHPVKNCLLVDDTTPEIAGL